MTAFNIFHTIRVRIGVRDAPHIWGAGEIRDAGERRLFEGLGRSERFVTPHIWGTGEMSTEISATYLGRWGNKYWKSRRIYVALGHDDLRKVRKFWTVTLKIFICLNSVNYIKPLLDAFFASWYWLFLWFQNIKTVQLMIVWIITSALRWKLSLSFM